MTEVSYPMPSDTRLHNDWFKSSFSSNANHCVEVRIHDELVSIRDSKYRRDQANNPNFEPVITVTAGQWAVVLDELTGRAPLHANVALSVETTPCGGAVLRAIEDGTTLTYTAAEWQSFLDGVRAGEFANPAVLS